MLRERHAGCAASGCGVRFLNPLLQSTWRSEAVSDSALVQRLRSLARMRTPASYSATSFSRRISPWENPLVWARRRLSLTLAMAIPLLLLHSVSALTQPGRSLRLDRESSRVATIDASRPRAVPPVGWRRTATGWQHVSTWRPFSIERTSLAEQVVSQREAEPRWLRDMTASLRRTPPGCFALAQLLAVGLLFLFFSSGVTKRVHRAGDSTDVSQTRLAR